MFSVLLHHFKNLTQEYAEVYYEVQCIMQPRKVHKKNTNGFVNDLYQTEPVLSINQLLFPLMEGGGGALHVMMMSSSITYRPHVTGKCFKLFQASNSASNYNMLLTFDHKQLCATLQNFRQPYEKFQWLRGILPSFQ